MRDARDASGKTRNQTEKKNFHVCNLLPHILEGSN